MKTHTIKTYDINELTPEAQQRALDHWVEHHHAIFWRDEILESLTALFDHCNGVTLKNYSLDYCQSWLTLSFDEDDARQLQGARAMAWIENNLIYGLRISWRGIKRKELSKYGRYYRPGMVKPCPFTGLCYDDEYIDALLKDIKEGATLEQAFEWLVGTYQKMYTSEIEEQQSLEYFKEHASANEYQFLKDGTQY